MKKFIWFIVFVALTVATAFLADKIFDYYNAQYIETLEELEQRY